MRSGKPPRSGLKPSSWFRAKSWRMPVTPFLQQSTSAERGASTESALTCDCDLTVPPAQPSFIARLFLAPPRSPAAPVSPAGLATRHTAVLPSAIAKDGVRLFYDESGTGRPLIFVHGVRRRLPKLGAANPPL